MLSSPVEDHNGRVRSGLNVGAAAGQTARETGSLAQTVGALAGSFVGGVLNPKRDEVMEQPAQIQRAQYKAQAAAAADKEQREQA